MSRRNAAHQRRRTRRRVTGGVAAVLALVVGAGVALTSCGGSDDKATKKAAPATTIPSTTTTVAPPIAPLTGLVDPSGTSLTRSSLAVKIENTPEARPQSGLDVADVVYEEVVEGGITRFWAVFNSAAPENVGPIRSVRVMDPDIVSPLGGVVAFSGGTVPNVALMRAAPVTWVDESNAADAFYREPKRFAPHNLFGDTAKLWARGGEPVPPKPLFTFLGSGESFPGEGVDEFHVGLSPGYDPTYTFDAASRTWKRSLVGGPFLDLSGNQVAPTNVIVQFVNYPANSEGQLIGEGDAWVFSDHRLVKGRWRKPDAVTPTAFVDAFGQPIRLTPGRTWVELAPTGATVDVVASPVPPPTTAPPPTTTTTLKKKK